MSFHFVAIIATLDRVSFDNPTVPLLSPSIFFNRSTEKKEDSVAMENGCLQDFASYFQ